MPPTNRALYLPAKKAKKSTIGSAPYTSPSSSQIVIRTQAIAMNPIDYLIPRKGDLLYTWLKYPFILGMDVAGSIVEVGSSVTRFSIGDRVIGLARGSDEKINDNAQGGFQEYVVLEQDLSCHIPSSMSTESAVVVPLGLCTAAAGLFEKDQLGLQLPTNSVAKPTGKTLIVWGGSTSVGCNAIQLAALAGYEVITTSSPRNFALCKKLGATHVFDYNSKTIVTDLLSAMKDKTAAGAMTIGDGGAEACMEVLSKTKGNKFIAMASFPVLKEEPALLPLPRTIFHFVSWIATFKARGIIKGVKSNFLIGSSIGYNSIGKNVWEGFLEKALEDGRFVPSPEPEIFGKGIECIEGAVEYLSKGVSAKKVVVTTLFDVHFC